MSKYRDRREKIQQQQSKSLDNLQLYREGIILAIRIYSIFLFWLTTKSLASAYTTVTRSALNVYCKTGRLLISNFGICNLDFGRFFMDEFNWFLRPFSKKVISFKNCSYLTEGVIHVTVGGFPIEIESQISFLITYSLAIFIL